MDIETVKLICIIKEFRITGRLLELGGSITIGKLIENFD